MRHFFWWTLLIVLIPASVSAHSLFIQSGRHHVHAGKGSPLFFCYGHHFPVDDAVRRGKLSYVKIISPQSEIRDVSLRDEKCLHSYIVDYEEPGTYVLTAETTPGYFTIWHDTKGRKRHSIKPMSAVVKKAATIDTSLRSSQWAKSYVTCDAPSPVFPGNIGLPLELVPSRDITQVKSGESIEIKVYSSGKPFAGPGYWDATYDGFSTQAEDMYIPRTKIEDGIFRLPVDVPGRWYVRFFTKTEAAKEFQSDCRHEKRTATLVFLVPNERKRPKMDSH